MKKIDLADLKAKIDADLISKKITGRTLLDRFRVIDEESRKTAPYLADNYCPFYYHLGKYVEPKFIMEIGFNLGLLSACFLTSCKSVEHYFGFKETDSQFNPIRLGKRNIRIAFKGNTDFFLGKLYDQELDKIFSPNSWDLIILNEETVYDKHLEYLEFIWPQLSEHGFIIAEYIDRHTPAKDAFFAFCESKNRTPITFETRYGTGILQK